MGPLPRSLAAEAHGCFMVRTPGGSNRTQGRGARFARTGRLPSVGFANPALGSHDGPACRQMKPAAMRCVTSWAAWNARKPDAMKPGTKPLLGKAVPPCGKAGPLPGQNGQIPFDRKSPIQAITVKELPIIFDLGASPM